MYVEAKLLQVKGPASVVVMFLLLLLVFVISLAMNTALSMLKNRWRLVITLESLKFTIFRRGMNEKTDLIFLGEKVVSL